MKVKHKHLGIFTVLSEKFDSHFDKCMSPMATHFSDTSYKDLSVLFFNSIGSLDLHQMMNFRSLQKIMYLMQLPIISILINCLPMNIPNSGVVVDLPFCL